MRKKIIAFLLVAAIVIGIAPLMSLAEEGDTVTAVRGDCTYALTADPDTGTVPDGFGTISNNGRIWTDKSVEIVDDSFNVNLKVLAQEYISTYGEVETTSIAADVVLILDITRSMVQYPVKMSETDSTEITRLQALVDAVNDSIEIIMNANENNRVVVYCYYGKTNNVSGDDANPMHCDELMSLGHYSNDSFVSSDPNHPNKDKYIVNTTSGTNRVDVETSSGLKKDGETISQVQISNTITGTNTQYGIAKSLYKQIEAINSETDKSIKRKPYVIMLTDGDPSVSHKNWYSDDPEELKDRTNRLGGSGGDIDAHLAATTILSAALWKDRLYEAYGNYNQQNGNQNFDIEWFNIGLGVEEEDPPTETVCLSTVPR